MFTEEETIKLLRLFVLFSVIGLVVPIENTSLKLGSFLILVVSLAGAGMIGLIGKIFYLNTKNSEDK